MLKSLYKRKLLRQWYQILFITLKDITEYIGQFRNIQQGILIVFLPYHQCIAAALQILDTQILDQLILFPLIVI